MGSGDVVAVGSVGQASVASVGQASVASVGQASAASTTPVCYDSLNQNLNTGDQTNPTVSNNVLDTPSPCAGDNATDSHSAASQSLASNMCVDRVMALGSITADSTITTTATTTTSVNNVPDVSELTTDNNRNNKEPSVSYSGNSLCSQDTCRNSVPGLLLLDAETLRDVAYILSWTRVRI